MYKSRGWLEPGDGTLCPTSGISKPEIRFGQISLGIINPPPGPGYSLDNTKTLHQRNMVTL